VIALPDHHRRSKRRHIVASRRTESDDQIGCPREGGPLDYNGAEKASLAHCYRSLGVNTSSRLMMFPNLSAKSACIVARTIFLSFGLTSAS
jgi:hypothetical protein